MTTRLNFKFFRVLSKNQCLGSLIIFFFSKKVSTVIFIKGLKPSLKRKMIKLLTLFDDLFFSLIL